MNGLIKPPCARFVAIPHGDMSVSKSFKIVGPFLHHLLALSQMLRPIVRPTVWVSDLVGELMLD